MRKLMWFAIGFGCACALGAYLFGTWLLWLSVGAAVVGIGLLIGCYWRRHFRIPAAIMLGLSIGVIWFVSYDRLVLTDPGQFHGHTRKATMTALDQSFEADYGSAADTELIVSGKAYKVRVYFDDVVNLWPGDLLSGEFQLKSASNHLRGKGIYLTATQRSEVKITSALSMPLRHYPAVWRIRLLERIDTLFPEDAAGFAKALLLGDRADIDYETNSAFRLSGISHIIAVSGLHVSILLALIFFLTGKNRFLSGIIGIPCLLLFTAVAGFTPSITRACIMQCLMLIALMCSRDYDSPTALAFAGLCILVSNPFAILSVSFQLSFGCMVGIFLFSDKIYDYLMAHLVGRGKIIAGIKCWFSASVSITLGANIVTTPLVACYFGAVSLVGAITNLVTLWIVSIIFYGVLFSLLFSVIWMPAGSVLAIAVSFLIRFVTGTAKLLASFPLAAVYTESPYIVIWLVACYVLLTAFLLMKRKLVLLFSCCIIGSLALSLAASYVEPRLDSCRVTMLDVGQGQAVILQSEGKTYLVDCGSGDPETAADKTADFLMSIGVFKLDGIIVTHYDSDHVGGIPFLLTRIKAETVFLPKAGVDEEVAVDLITAASDRVFWVENDINWTFGDASIQLYAPESLDSGNESSVCILFQTENCDILITGDRSRKGELALLQRAALPELELLIAGHHGSASATSDSLLALTSPEHVFISVGAGNRYGHPSDKVLERLEKYGCNVFRTDEQGTLIFRR